MRRRHRWLAGLAMLAAAGPASAAAAITQPAAPAASSYEHQGVRITSGGRGANGFFIFEPAAPAPVNAPVAILSHGYFEFSGYRQLEALARHTAQTGTVVIYTRWQTGIATPCPGPFFVQPCIDSEARGIRDAIAYLRSQPDRVQPDLERTSYFGFSFGGILTANVASRWQRLGLPQPRAVFLDDPHDGGFTPEREYALDDSLAGIPASTKVLCHSGAAGVIAKGTNASCNVVVPRLAHVPAANKSLVLTVADKHGRPALSSEHGVCAGSARRGAEFGVDAYDWGFCWRAWDALRACALTGVDCDAALGDTSRNRHIGTWSDGTPIKGLKIQAATPIRSTPPPPRAPAPDA